MSRVRRGRARAPRLCAFGERSGGLLLAAGSEVNRSRPWSAAFFLACYGQGAAVIEWNILVPETSGWPRKEAEQRSKDG